MRSRTRRRVSITAVMGIALAAPLVAPAGADAASGCRSGNPLTNVWSPGRLKVLNGTTTAEEIVKVAQVEGVIVDQ